MDRYFNGQDGVIQVFDFDYEKVVKYQWEVMNNNELVAFVTCPIYGILCCAPHFMCNYDNVKDSVEAQHLCITQDGIRYVVDKHKTGCRLDCQDQGKVTKTVPYDKLTDCDIEEPAGAEGPVCCMVDRVLTTVNVDTASGSRDDTSPHELMIKGLVNPKAFKDAVWQCKRGEHPGLAELRAAPRQQAMGTDPTVYGAAKMGDNAELVCLLQRNNELLEEIARNTKK